MAKCDMCGGQCDALKMVQLKDIYRVDGVKDLCPSCGKKVEEKLSEIQLAIVPKMREFVRFKSKESFTKDTPSVLLKFHVWRWMEE